jgi:hypothetical protein
MTAQNLINTVNNSKPLYLYNREERNLAALLYAALLMEENLLGFLKLIGNSDEIIQNELAIHYEYSLARDIWHQLDKQLTRKEANTKKRHLIESFLDLRYPVKLGENAIEEFNALFGAKPKASKEYIQSPATWSIQGYMNTIEDNDDFRKICGVKWAFKAKPDIVIHTSNKTAVCVEVKLHSGEGVYPTDPKERAEFKKRGIKPVSQTAIQQYLMECILGVETQYVVIQSEQLEIPNVQVYTWKEVFLPLNLSFFPGFARKWVDDLIK